MKELQFKHREHLIDDLKLGDILELRCAARSVKMFVLFKTYSKIGGYIFFGDNFLDKKNTFVFLYIDSLISLYYVYRV